MATPRRHKWLTPPPPAGARQRDGAGRRVVCLVPGGVVEQLRFMPLLGDIRAKVPAARIDVVASEVARGAYALCPFVGRTVPFELDAGEIPDQQVCGVASAFASLLLVFEMQAIAPGNECCYECRIKRGR